jgi:hypothetical protein
VNEVVFTPVIEERSIQSIQFYACIICESQSARMILVDGDVVDALY